MIQTVAFLWLLALAFTSLTLLVVMAGQAAARGIRTLARLGTRTLTGLRSSTQEQLASGTAVTRS